jgi:hypothetical protein
MGNLSFKKTGKEVKAAITNRRVQLQERLARRNLALNEFLKDNDKVRSYLIRSTLPNWGHGERGYVLAGKEDISSEERQEVDQLCQRIFEIEQELHRLAYIVTHLEDDQGLSLSIDELVGYGFEPQK